METADTAGVLRAPVVQSVRLTAGFQDQMHDIAIAGEFSPEAETKIGSTMRTPTLPRSGTNVTTHLASRKAGSDSPRFPVMALNHGQYAGGARATKLRGWQS